MKSFKLFDDVVITSGAKRGLKGIIYNIRQYISGKTISTIYTVKLFSNGNFFICKESQLKGIKRFIENPMPRIKVRLMDNIEVTEGLCARCDGFSENLDLEKWEDWNGDDHEDFLCEKCRADNNSVLTERFK